MRTWRSSLYKLTSSFLIYLIIIVPFFTACGSGGGGDNAENPSPSDQETIVSEPVVSESGTISIDPDSGMAVYEGQETEIMSGVLLKRSTNMIPINSEDEQQGYKGLGILKLTNTTNSSKEVSLFEIIPKNFAENIHQMKFKIVTGEPGANKWDTFNNLEDFVTITDLVNLGYAKIVDEDPSLIITLGLPVLGSLLLFYFHAEILGFTPYTDSNFRDSLTDEESRKWINDRLAGYCDTIRTSAEQNNIPPRLLANVILNELQDYDRVDQLQEVVNTGSSHSHGWSQLQVQRLIEHGLIDVGTEDKIRDPDVDISEDELTVTIRTEMGASLEIPVNPEKLMWQRLLNPKIAIELAAREVAYLLDMLKKDKEYVRNPWAVSLLINPTDGIDRDDIYSNLQIDPLSNAGSDSVKQQIEREKTLVMIVVPAYNGGGHILRVENKNSIFIQHDNPWAKDEQSPLSAPREHGVNAMFLSDDLYRYSCLQEEIFPKIYKGSSTYTVSTSLDFGKAESAVCTSNPEWTVTLFADGKLTAEFGITKTTIVSTSGAADCYDYDEPFISTKSGSHSAGHFEFIQSLLPSAPAVTGVYDSLTLKTEPAIWSYSFEYQFGDGTDNRTESLSLSLTRKN